MYRFTLIKEDGTVHIDNQLTLKMDFTKYNLPNDLHAIQWKNGQGHIEYMEDSISYGVKKENEFFTDLTPYAEIIADARARIELELNPPPPEPTKTNLKNSVTSKRVNIANGAAMFTVNQKDIPVWIDERSRSSLTSAVLASSLDPNLTVDWKGSDGNFYTLNSQEIIELGTKLFNFIQSLFEIENELFSRINNDTLTTFAEIETYPNWPVNWVSPTPTP